MKRLIAGLTLIAALAFPTMASALVQTGQAGYSPGVATACYFGGPNNIGSVCTNGSFSFGRYAFRTLSAGHAHTKSAPGYTNFINVSAGGTSNGWYSYYSASCWESESTNGYDTTILTSQAYAVFSCTFTLHPQNTQITVQSWGRWDGAFGQY